VFRNSMNGPSFAPLTVMKGKVMNDNRTKETLSQRVARSEKEHESRVLDRLVTDVRNQAPETESAGPAAVTVTAPGRSSGKEINTPSTRSDGVPRPAHRNAPARPGNRSVQSAQQHTGQTIGR